MKGPRTDIHRPSTVIPKDYQYVGVWTADLKRLDNYKFIQYEREACNTHMHNTQGTLVHKSGGLCGICGNTKAIYLALFYHAKSNEYIVVGAECARKLNLEFDKLHVSAFIRKLKNARNTEWKQECFMKTIAWG